MNVRVKEKASSSPAASGRNITIEQSSTTAAAEPTISVIPSPAAPSGDKKNVENAVYGYIRAMRGLGHKTINTAEIASALGLTEADVEGTLDALKKKGVKVAG